MTFRCTQPSSLWLSLRTRSWTVLGAAGSCSTAGTTLIAAEKTGRHGYLMELDPAYVDVTIERFQKLTGTNVFYAATDLTFEQMRVQRAKQNQKAPASAAPQPEE